MKQIDRFLLAIIAGTVLLVIIALVLAMTRSEQGYLPETSPSNIAHNYVFAIKQHDDERAYSYLSPNLNGYPPDVDAFTADISTYYSWQFDRENRPISIESERITGDRATVTIVETHFYQSGPFSSNQYKNTVNVTLRRQNDTWQLTSADSYWAACWNKQRPCE